MKLPAAGAEGAPAQPSARLLSVDFEGKRGISAGNWAEVPCKDVQCDGSGFSRETIHSLVCSWAPSVTFMAASLTSSWGLLPPPATHLPAGPCHVLQDPPLLPLLGIRGQSKETFPPTLLAGLCRLPATPGAEN